MDHSRHEIDHDIDVLPPGQCRLCCTALGWNAVSGLMLFIICGCISLAITVTIIGGNLFGYFSSCQGITADMSHLYLGILLLMQFICFSIKLDYSKFVSRLKQHVKVEVLSNPANFRNQSNLFSDIYTANTLEKPHIESRNKWWAPMDRTIRDAHDEDHSVVEYHNKFSPSTAAGSTMDDSSFTSAQPYVSSLQLEVQHGNSTQDTSCICWNSIWMIFHHLLYCLGFHAAVLGWRTYGETDTNAYTFQTCKHLNQNSFGSNLPITRNLVSDFAYVELVAAASTCMLSVRKFGFDPYKLSSYIRFLHYSKCCCSLEGVALIQTLIQICIIGTAITNVVLAWIHGFGTPGQILCGTLVSATVIWIISVLTHVLQTDRLNPPFKPTLSLHAFWSNMNVFIVWLCGFFFYVTVYGVDQWEYVSLHGIIWCIYILISICGHNRIFINRASSDEEYLAWLMKSNAHDHNESSSVNLDLYSNQAVPPVVTNRLTNTSIFNTTEE